MDFNDISTLIRQDNQNKSDSDGNFKNWIVVFLIFLTVIFASRVFLVLIFAAAQKLLGRNRRTRPNNGVAGETDSVNQNSPHSQSPRPTTSITAPPVVILHSFQNPSARMYGHGMQRYPHSHAGRAGGQSPPPNIDDLNSFVIENEKQHEPCPVCLEPLGQQPVSTGQCLHLCHTSCMKSWLAKDRTASCPVCRVTLHDAVSIDNTLQPAMSKSHATSSSSATPSTSV